MLHGGAVLLLLPRLLVMQVRFHHLHLALAAGTVQRLGPVVQVKQRWQRLRQLALSSSMTLLGAVRR
jgi:hypothetical protein